MAEQFAFDVFVRYANQDESIVRVVAERLLHDGLNVWFDEWIRESGESNSAKPEDGLELSRILLLCLSKNTTRAAWATKKSDIFPFSDPLNIDRRCIVLRLDGAEIRPPLSRFLTIDWQSSKREGEYTKLLEACRRPIREFPEETQAVRDPLAEKVIFLGHIDWVRSVAFSPDGGWALSASADTSVRLWEVDTGRCVRILEGHTATVRCVAWSPDGLRALSASDDGTLRLWEVATGRCERVFEEHTDHVNSVAWSPDGLRALSASSDCTIRLWEPATGRCEGVINADAGHVRCVAWSPIASQALSVSSDQSIRLWDLTAGCCERILKGHTNSIWSVAWSPDGMRALSASSDQTIRLWEIATGRCLRTFDGHCVFVKSVVWSADGLRALSASDDRTIRLWDIATGRCEQVLEGHTDYVNCVSWSPDNLRALSSADDRTVRLWNVATVRSERLFGGHSYQVNSVSWSHDNQRALSASTDQTIRLWNAATGLCERIFRGHAASVNCVAWCQDDNRALSASSDRTIRLWDVETGRRERVFEGHTEAVNCVTWSLDNQRALSASSDRTIRLWNVATGRCECVFQGHTDFVISVAWSPDGRHALSASSDRTVRLWDVATGRCECVFHGHTNLVISVAWNPDGHQALSASSDRTIRLWDLEARRCARVFEGHTDSVNSVAWSANGQHALSASSDQTVRLWELATGRCNCILEGHTDDVRWVAWSKDDRQALSVAANGVTRVWDTFGLVRLSSRHADGTSLTCDVQYTNAKALVVGDTHSGKTGLTRRLATDEWHPSEASTVGVWATQWKLRNSQHETAQTQSVEREIWLWDFGGQADQRLVHQLYMYRCSVILLLFDADQEEVLVGLRDWRVAIKRSVPSLIPQFLVAGRVDAGCRASRTRIQSFAQEEKLSYHETSALTGQGCDELREALRSSIDWDSIPITTTERLFKVLKDEILKLRDEGQVLLTFKELRDLLWRRLPNEMEIPDAALKTVIGLLDGPGVVQELEFGTFILLQPEWINTYAQAVLQTLRSDPQELGALPLRSVAEGKLVYQSVGRNGIPVETKRLNSVEEQVVLGEMERQLMERGLCLRQGDKLVFPSHCGRERPTAPEYPPETVSYKLEGYLDDLYATLVVRLADCGAFIMREIWRDSADFKTLQRGNRLGIKLTRNTASRGEISVYFGPGVSSPEQVIFAKYIHNHLHSRGENVQRVRHYVCPHCGTAKGNSLVLMKRLASDKDAADTECDNCVQRFKLWDELEQVFASDELRQQVEGLEAKDLVRLDSRRKGKLLALEVGARITSADQKCFEIPGTEDEGIDMDVEFTDDQGKGTGQHLYLQLKSGNSHLRKRKDGTEIFGIDKQDWVEYWRIQPHPVMLVIGTFVEDERKGHSPDRDRLEFDQVRWMEIRSVLEHLSDGGKKPVKQIEFKGERVDIMSILRWRQKFLPKTDDSAFQ